MLSYGNQIRLTKREAERFTKVSGIPPTNVKSITDLDAYVDLCKQKYAGKTEDHGWILFLLEDERSSCLRCA